MKHTIVKLWRNCCILAQPNGCAKGSKQHGELPAKLRLVPKAVQGEAFWEAFVNFNLPVFLWIGNFILPCVLFFLFFLPSFPWFAKCSMWNFGGSNFNLFVVLKVHMTTLSSCGICAAKAVFYPWTMDALWNVLQFFLLVEFAYQQVKESSNSYLHSCIWSVLVFVITTVR